MKISCKQLVSMIYTIQMLRYVELSPFAVKIILVLRKDLVQMK